MSEVVKRDKTRYCNIRDIFSEFTDAEVHERCGKQFRFPMYMDDKLARTDVTALNLSVRSENCLRRAGISTIGELCSNFQSSEELKKLRNCGSTSTAEIMDHLFAYQYNLLEPEWREAFLTRVMEMNQK